MIDFGLGFVFGIVAFFLGYWWRGKKDQLDRQYRKEYMGDDDQLEAKG
jgi:hypothetical protein